MIANLLLYCILQYRFLLNQLLQLEQRLAELKKEKHGLFSELKKVLHQENEIRQRETERQMKEQKCV